MTIVAVRPASTVVLVKDVFVALDGEWYFTQHA